MFSAKSTAGYNHRNQIHILFHTKAALQLMCYIGWIYGMVRIQKCAEEGCSDCGAHIICCRCREKCEWSEYQCVCMLSIALRATWLNFNCTKCQIPEWNSFYNCNYCSRNWSMCRIYSFPWSMRIPVRVECLFFQIAPYILESGVCQSLSINSISPVYLLMNSQERVIHCMYYDQWSLITFRSLPSPACLSIKCKHEYQMQTMPISIKNLFTLHWEKRKKWGSLEINVVQVSFSTVTDGSIHWILC